MTSSIIFPEMNLTKIDSSMIDLTKPLIPHLGIFTPNYESISTFIDPFVGDGLLVKVLHQLTNMTCLTSYDIKPKISDFPEEPESVFYTPEVTPDYFITRPPLDRAYLYKVIPHFSDIAPTWLLVDAKWVIEDKPTDIAARCKKIVLTKGDFAWCLFDKWHNGAIAFILKCDFAKQVTSPISE